MNLDEILRNTAEDMMTGRALPVEMLEDFLRISALEAETCRRVQSELRSVVSVLDASEVDSIIEAAVVDKETAESVQRALISMTPSSLGHFMRKLDEWVNNEERASVFTQEVRKRLKSNLKSLVQKYHVVSVMQKATELQRAIGHEYMGVRFICDLRPVFDEEKTTVEAMVVVTTMQLSYRDQQGANSTIEIVLNDDELKMMSENTEQAVAKLDILNKLRAEVFFKK